MSSTTHTIDPNFKKGGTIGPIEQLDLTTSNPQTVAVVDGGGAQITSFGGGTQYTEGDTDATITGTAFMWEDAADTLRAVSSAKPLPVSVTGGGDATAANQATIIGHVDGIETLLGTIDADTGTIAGAVSGTEMQVDVLTMPTVAVTQSGLWDEVGINDSGNSITVDYATTGSGTATGALRVELPTNGTGVIATVGAVTAITNALPAGTNAIGKLAANSGVDIGDVDILSIAAGDNNIGNVDIVSGTITTVSTVTTVSTLTGGGVAHDAADSGNPHKVGGIAYSPDGTTPGTAVAELDRSNLKTDLNGRLFVNPVSPQRGHTHLDGSTAYTDQALVASPGAGFQTVITSIIVSTGAATAMNFFLEEGSTKIFGPIYLEATAGRGFVSGPITLPVTAATAVTITTSASIAQSVDVDYYIQAV